MLKKREAPATEQEFTEVIIQNPARLRAAMVADLRVWLKDLIAELCPSCSFGARLDTDRAVAEANERWRGVSGATDVLSFAGDSSGGSRHLGDVWIAVPTARRQAERAGHSLERELRILLLHGALHCLGYDHETDGGSMNRLEKNLRRKWIGTKEQTPVGAPS